MAGILTFAEQRDGKLRRASLETLSEARRLAGALAASVTTVVVGPGTQELAAELTAQGADTVVAFDDPGFASYATEAYARALAQAIADAKPAVVLIPFTAMGKDLAPRVAARVGAGLASDCVALELKDGRLVGRRPMYAGKAYATVEWAGEPQLATLRPNVFPLGPKDPSRPVALVRGSVDAAARARVTSVTATTQGKLQLGEAQIVVSGGRGLKGPENFHLVEKPGRGARRRGRRLARGRRRRLGRPPAPGRTDRPHRVAHALRRVRHQRRDPAPRGHVVLEVHRRDQQGQGRADLQGRRLRDRGRSLRGAAAPDGGRQGPPGRARLEPRPTEVP